MGFFGLLFRLFHFIHTLKVLVYDFSFKTNRYLSYPFAKLLPGKVEKDSECLKKLPIHIGAIIIEDDLSYTDISNLILWSLMMGITYISIYDHSGNIKRNKSLLSKSLKLQQPKILGNSENIFDIHIHQSGCANKKDSSYSNKQRIDVLLLSAEDGKRSIVSAAKCLSASVCENQYRCCEINTQLIDKILQDKNGFPDPDLILKFGKIDSLVGFLPWQMRLAEILSLPSHKGFSQRQFLQALRSFGDIEMRFGK